MKTSLKFSINYPDVIKSINNYVIANGDTVVINGKRYTDLDVLAQGGFGTVYSARLGLNDQYVIKIVQMSPDDLASEIGVMKLLNSYSTKECYPFASCYVDDNISSPFFVIPDRGPRPQDKRGPVMGIVLRRTIGEASFETMYDNDDLPETVEQKTYFISQVVTTLVSTYALLEHLHIAHNDMKPENLLYDTLSTAPYYKFYVSDFGGAIQYAPGPIPTTIKQLGSPYATTKNYDYFLSIKPAALFKANDAWEVAITIMQMIIECVLNDVWDPELNFPVINDTIETDPAGCVHVLIDLLRAEKLESFYGFNLDALRDILLRFVSITDDPANGDGAFAFAMEQLKPDLSAIKASSVAEIDTILTQWPTFHPRDSFSRAYVVEHIQGQTDIDEIRSYTNEIVRIYKEAIVLQVYPELVRISKKVFGSSPSIRDDDYDAITALRDTVRDALVKKIHSIDPTIVPEETIQKLAIQFEQLHPQSFGKM
jgi:serine/threonine protein kinase